MTILTKKSEFYDDRGREIVDSRPLSLPVKYSTPPSYMDEVRRMIRNELSRAAISHGHETWEEADDFDVGDDFEPNSPWELTADQEAVPVRPPRKPRKPKNKQAGGQDAREPPPDGSADLA